MNLKNFVKKHSQILRYIFWGVAATVVNIFFFHLFNLIFGEGYHLITNVLSWCITVAFAFFTNKLFVFKSKSWKAAVIRKELIGFVGARTFSLIIEELGLWLLVDIINMEEIQVKFFSYVLTGTLIAKTLLQIVVVIANYIFSKCIIFADKSKVKNKYDKVP